MNGRSCEIPSRIGKLAVIEWGASDGEPILALHGWQDNALSFQPLAKHLDSDLHIVAFDFCGHGLSSHLGRGHVYDSIQYLQCVLEVTAWFKWDKFSLLAHSMGAIISMEFVALYPERIKHLITLDITYPHVLKPTDRLPTSDGFSMFLKLESKEFSSETAVPLSWDVAVNNFMKPRPHLSRENVELLLQRGTRRSRVKEGRFEFTRDRRTLIGDYFEYSRLEAPQIMNSFTRYRGTWLAIMASDSEMPLCSRSPEKVTEEHTKNCQRFQVVTLETKAHYIHMEFPKLISSHIKKWFTEHLNSNL